MEGQQWTKLVSLLNIDPSSYEDLEIPEAFSKFHAETNNVSYLEWLDVTLTELPKKSNTKSETIRCVGNTEHVRGNFKEAIKWYTMSLHFAEFNTPDYGKALANRSASTFALQEYEESLKDIVACLETEYPEELRNKVLLRQLQVYYHLSMDKEFNKHVEELKDVFRDNEIYIKCVESYNDQKQEELLRDEENAENMLNMNATFVNATDLVELRYDDNKGRYVAAVKDIQAGKILFKEEAFVAAQIFKSREELELGVCYNCLKHIPYFSLPCPTCTYCLYCSNNCKEASWQNSHRFECPGMIIFYELGQALPAFKCLMKGMASRFQEADKTSSKFGDLHDNYPFANSLVCHFATRSDKMHLLGVALIVVLYLKQKTDFFDYLHDTLKSLKSINQEGDSCSEVNAEICDDLDVLVGKILVRHMVQLFNNGSIVERCNNSDVRPIAAAIYPSISMMNHSCRSNITIEYTGNVAVVKANEDISGGEEVFNSYGVDYTIDKDIRQKYLLENYGFQCVCPVCTNAANKSEILA